jgi:hypothetical protein
MPIPEFTESDTCQTWAVLLTTRQRWLLEACVAWHARVHHDVRQRAEFAELTQIVRNARTVREAN